MKRTSKIFVWGLTISIIAIITVLWVCDQIVTSNALGKTCDEIDSVQYREVGLLLGTTPQTRIGNRRNLFFKYRIDAAEELYKNGKIRKILISGDENSLDGINEPECMRDSLVARGVPSEAIMLDGKGFRTILSVLHANQRYGLKSFTIISQRFHNERALYQAEHLGLDVENLQAFNATSPISELAIMTYVREYFARVKMFWDLWTFV